MATCLFKRQTYNILYRAFSIQERGTFVTSVDDIFRVFLYKHVLWQGFIIIKCPRLRRRSASLELCASV